MDRYTELFKKSLIGYFDHRRPRKIDVSKKTGISRSQLDKYLDPNDETSPTLETIAKLSEALEADFFEANQTDDVNRLALALFHKDERIRELEANNVSADYSQNLPNEVKKDALLERIIALWPSLNEHQRGALSKMADGYAGISAGKKTIEPTTKHKKSNS